MNFRNVGKKLGKRQAVIKLSHLRTERSTLTTLTELRKENSQEYEPDSLTVMRAALARPLTSQSCLKSIPRDTESPSSEKVLEGKMRKLCEQGRGKLPNKAKSLTIKKRKYYGKMVNKATKPLI